MKISHEWNFGNNKELAEKLKDAVLSGKKRATTGLYSGVDGRVSLVGDYEAILDSNNKRFCIIQITKVEIKHFLDVEYDFIEKEGEKYRNIEDWRNEHRKFFNMTNDNVRVVCEEFELISVLTWVE